MTILAEAIRQFPITETVLQQSYENLQWSKGYFSILHKTVAQEIQNFFYSKQEIPDIEPALAQQLQQRVAKLLNQDWEDAKAGYYPIELLFDEAWQDFFKFYPQVCIDLPSTWERSHHNRTQEFNSSINPQEYPEYYTQNFHHQTDGYLSESSANLYDIQVELLFGGKADAMRRRILPHLKRSLAQHFTAIAPQDIQLLDLGCGTGRTLLQLQAAFPDAQLTGLDLSPTYLKKAQSWLSQRDQPCPQLVNANGEQCPFPDQSFHGISNVFMLHELPEEARHQILVECYRLLKPGGTLVICDSIQHSDSPDFAPMILAFATRFHEPFYENYVQDNLTDRLSHIGFENFHTEVHLLSKYLVAHKPL